MKDKDRGPEFFTRTAWRMATHHDLAHRRTCALSQSNGDSLATTSHIQHETKKDRLLVSSYFVVENYLENERPRFIVVVKTDPVFGRDILSGCSEPIRSKRSRN